MILNNMQQDSFFSIGEFVRVCGTTRATLYHYEKINLLSPTVNELNGYRYYKLSDFYLYMYIAHLTRIGYSLEEIRDYVEDKSLHNYISAQEDSFSRLTRQQNELRLRNERTQRGLKALNRSLDRPINLPQITYREEEHFLRMPFDGNLNGKDCIACQALHRKYAAEHGIDLQRHFLGFYSDMPLSHQPPAFGYVITKMNERHDCECLFSRPSGVYISMCYRGPYAQEGNQAYGIISDYMETHRFKALTGMFVEEIVGPFISSDPREYIAEISVMIE